MRLVVVDLVSAFDELMLHTSTYDLEDRLHSLKLIAKAWDAVTV